VATGKKTTHSFASFSETALQKIIDPFSAFLSLQQASGYLLLLATFIALILANSPIGPSFNHFWHSPFVIQLGDLISMEMTLEQVINDGLMTIFFTVVGLEIKRELKEGALSTKEQAMLPVIGALGGMFFPCLIFLAFNWGKPTAPGWAIPAATDIAFSLAVIQLLGNKVPLSLKVFLTALAVVDDLGAILIIAISYSHDLQWIYLLYSLGVVLLLWLMNRANVRNIFAYSFVGFFLWVFMHSSGIHATISGVLLALCMPFRFKDYEKLFANHLKEVQEYSSLLGTSREELKPELRDQIINEMQRTSNLMEAPLNHMLHMLHGFSSYFVMPLFALSNSGIKLNLDAVQNLLSPLSLGIFFGLLVGKSCGITVFTYLSSKLKITTMPVGVQLYEMFLVNILAGIGFTMSIFVSNLAFDDPSMIDTSKFSIIITSFTAGLVGYFLNYRKKETLAVL
jgi:NhaA family Na+:H+ antiporter